MVAMPRRRRRLRMRPWLPSLRFFFVGCFVLAVLDFIFDSPRRERVAVALLFPPRCCCLLCFLRQNHGTSRTSSRHKPELPFIATVLDYGHPGISDTTQNCRNTLYSVNRATIALNIPFPVISGPEKPPHQQYELGRLIAKEREFHQQRMTQKGPFASLVERS